MVIEARRQLLRIELTIANLPTIPLQRAQCRALQILPSINVESDGVSPLLFELLGKVLPDLLALLVRKILVVELHVDAGDEGIIESTDPVGCEEEDAVVELEGAKEA
jgi:hypothetical protein